MSDRTITEVTLGPSLDLTQFMAVARFGASVNFSDEYRKRVNKARTVVEQWVAQEKVMYGVTTGFGALCTRAISGQETEALQKNILLSHSVSLGAPLSMEAARATMLMILQNLGQGYSGVRFEVLERLGAFLNLGLTPWMPREGSVGYLSPEAHLGLCLIGEGQLYYKGELLPAAEALRRVGLAPLALAAKEGLALISGTTSATALAALAVYDLLQAARAADIIGALNLETMGGVIRAFDPRVMSVRPHPEQADTAENVRRILADSEFVHSGGNGRVQDALSLRCIPQLHGAAKKLLLNALDTVEIEMNSCCDNPIVWPQEGAEDVISACNADSSYIGSAMDTAAIAAAMLAKMSERRNNRLIDESLSGFPCFLIGEPGLNSGLMIPQYTQAGLLNDMRILATPASIDNTPTCANQEDYVAMGYNAAKKAVIVAEKLESILAIELLSVFAAQSFVTHGQKISRVGTAIYEEIGKRIPKMERDIFLYPHIVFLQELIHTGKFNALAEELIGPLK